MRTMPWPVYIWPGLPQIWARGSWPALAVALAAATGLNAALLVTLGWDELLTPISRSALWGGLGGMWIGAGVFSLIWEHRRGSQREPDAAGDTYREAQGHYLKGNWFEAERLLGRILRSNARDMDARLMLAALLRHTGRRDEAAGQLDLLVRLDGSEKWEWEIRRERQLLTEAHPTVAYGGDQ